jgi:hypothetical protein
MLVDDDDAPSQQVKRAFQRLQSWLLFGLVHELGSITGQEIDQNGFVVESGRYLRTIRLNTYFRASYNNINGDSSAIVTALVNTFMKRLLLYRFTSAWIEEFGSSFRVLDLQISGGSRKDHQDIADDGLLEPSITANPVYSCIASII